MFKLRVYSEVGSKSYNNGMRTSIWASGTKKRMVEIAKKHNLRAEVVRERDNAIVFENGIEAHTTITK